MLDSRKLYWKGRDTAAMRHDTPTLESRGYPKLANLMGPYPEIAIFRRFGSLTMLNLMSLQAELLVIEDELQKVQREDNASKDSETYSTNFHALNHSVYPNNHQRLLLESSRKKLEEYRAYWMVPQALT